MLHNQGSDVIEVIGNANFTISQGECIALTGASGTGNSTLMRTVYGNHLTQKGEIRIGDISIMQAEPRETIALRRDVWGYVSQFLRVVPRESTLDVVAEPLRAIGVSATTAQDCATALHTRLNIPQTLLPFSPTSFSVGEQQRVNVARGFAHAYPAMRRGEPTASLDPVNRAVELNLIEEAKARGAEIVGIFYDAATRDRLRGR